MLTHNTQRRPQANITEAARQDELARALVFTPAQAAAAAVEYYRNLATHKGDPLWGVPEIDRQMLAPRDGDVIGIIGRPGHGKSTSLASIARHKARILQFRNAEHPDEEPGVVMYFSLEQLVEEMEAMFQAAPGLTATEFMAGELPVATIEKASLDRPALPLWVVGRSIASGRGMPRMTADNLFAALRGMSRAFGVRVKMVCLDYIQILPVENTRERVFQVGEAIINSKELAQAIGCPLVFGVQANRASDGREDKIPGMADCQWASQLEQTADKLFGVARPWLWRFINKQVLTPQGDKLDVEEFMLYVRKLKERFAKFAGSTYLIDMDPGLVALASREQERNYADASSLL